MSTTNKRSAASGDILKLAAVPIKMYQLGDASGNHRNVLIDSHQKSAQKPYLLFAVFMDKLEENHWNRC